jgi:hypothetical protein
MKMETTVNRLEAILSEISNGPLREDLFSRFFLENPLQIAKLLHSLSLPDSVKAKLLALRVGMPPSYKGTDLEPLISRAMEQMWQRLIEVKV